MRKSSKATQSGLSLIFAMLALLALTIGAVALVRSVDMGVLTLGNLSHKQSALVAAGRATEEAIEWIRNAQNKNLTDADSPDNGYYASAMPQLDVTGAGANSANAATLVRVAWLSNGNCDVDGVEKPSALCLKASPEKEYGGIKARYVIHRMCRTPGAIKDTNTCAKPVIQGDVSAPDKGSCQDLLCKDLPVAIDPGPYYRITTRAESARGSVSFTETLINF